MASIKQVAKKAGVGIATVSRVINNSGYVKKETRIKVESVIKELEYKPNEIARSMTRQKNGIVAFIIPNAKHLFFGELIDHIEQELFEYGYKLLICNSSKKIEKEIVYLDMLKNNRVDAIIFLTNNDIEGYLDKSLPLISFDRRFEGIPFVSSDNYAGGVMAANHLYEKGCRNLMFIGDDAQGENTIVNTEVSYRRKGFLDQLNKLGIKSVIDVEYPLGDYIEIPEKVFDSINKHRDIDGVFCISDSVAHSVIKNIEKNGRRVPEDVRVIGFDGGRSFINLGKRITSISQDPKLIAKATVELINKYYDKEVVESKIVPVHFSYGDTT
jgi:DNA-binding LacI/PurR family transcriptional regulator